MSRTEGEEFKGIRLAATKANLLLTTFTNMSGIRAFKTQVVLLCHLANKYNASLGAIPKELDFKGFVVSHPELQLVQQGEWIVARKGADLALRPFNWNFASPKTMIVNFVPPSKSRKQEGTKKRKSVMKNKKSPKRQRCH